MHSRYEDRPLSTPGFFVNDTRRSDYAWTDWAEIAAFLGDQAVCRIGVNDGPWPYVVAQTFAFTGTAFLLHFSRSGKLAAALRADPHCTIEVDQAVSLLKAPNAENTSAEYRSVVARCTGVLTDVDLDIEAQQYATLDKYRPEADYRPIDRVRATRRILSLRADIVTLSAKKRILAEGGNPAGVAYERYPYPPPAALSSLPPEAFTARFDANGERLR
jgi:nitroimidazol reductase NimA-like FMN-containing flavoprotein (pyridoxamine 5'-phosphate oxidase superfamily)